MLGSNNRYNIQTTRSCCLIPDSGCIGREKHETVDERGGLERLCFFLFCFGLGVKKYRTDNIAVEDNHGWKKVEKGIERYMLASKKDIIVKLAVLYSKTGVSDTDSS